MHVFKRINKRMIAWALAAAMVAPMVPGQVVEATGGTGHVHDYVNGTWYADPESHYAVCAGCDSEEHGLHADTNNDGACDGCEASVSYDGLKNLYIHNHTGSNPTQKDADQHFSTCSTCGRIYNEYHWDNVENGNASNVTPDGLCDACGYGTPICQVHTHKVVNGEYQYETGPAGHRPICGNCDQPYDGEAHYDNDSDNICDVCGFAISCFHTNMGRWWDTAETEHTHHCVCGYPVSPAESHTDALQNNDGTAGADNLCDVCGVGVDSTLKHIHIWCTGWSKNNDNTEHFNDCIDTACTVSANAHSAVDADASGRCDICDLSMNKQGSQSCIHTPRQNSDGSYVYIVGEEEHYNVCDNCNTTYTIGIAHTDTDNDGSCDECHAPIVLANGKYSHTHTLNPNGPFAVSPVHYDRCDTCGSDLNETAHIDSDGNNLCDGCGTTVTKDSDGAYRHYCANSAPKAMDENSHAETCPNCVQKNNWANHSDTDCNKVCDECFATLDAAGKHVHQPDGNWSSLGPVHTCKCTECEEWVNEGHSDNDHNNICDKCKVQLSNNGNQGGGTSCLHTGFLWWDTSEMTHQRHCGACGKAIAFVEYHTDTIGDGKCDTCGVGIDVQNIHTHAWSATWSAGGSSHFHDCADNRCTVSTDPMAHFDDDNDDVCDACAEPANPDWCTGHIHNNKYQVMADKHYKKCANCDNMYGDGEAHVQGVDSWRGEDISHYPVCDICWSSYGVGQPHTDADEDHRCDECETELSGGNLTHVHNFTWSADETEHVLNCDNCSVQTDRAYHIDSDSDGRCDDCNASVIPDTNVYLYVHQHIPDTKYVIDRYDHIKYCTDCGWAVIWQGHIDHDNNWICDDCGTKLTTDNDGKLVHDHTASAWIDCDDGRHHRKDCTVCGEQTIEVANHVDATMDGVCDDCSAVLNHKASNGYRVSQNGHEKYCVNCGMSYPEEVHDDADKDGYCNFCYIDVDSTGKHVHTEPSYMTADMNEHFKECPNCRLMIPGTATVHTDADGDTKCDGCNAVLNASNEHFHDDKVIYINNMVHKYCCNGCDTVFEITEHWDQNNDSVCDDCKTSYVKVNAGLLSAGDLLNRFKAALIKAVNNSDYSDLEVFFDRSQAVDFTEIYKDILSKEPTAVLRIALNSVVATAKDCATDADIKLLFDSAKAAVGSKLTVDKIFLMDILAEISHRNGATASSCGELNNRETLEYVLNFNAGDVKSNRIWYVYASIDDGATYTKVAETAKGASSVSFKYERFYDTFVLAYEDVATSGSGAGSGSSSDKEEAEDKKEESKPTLVETAPAPQQSTKTETTTTTSSTSSSTTASDSTQTEEVEAALPAMPENADTTVVEIVASEEVVEAVKETVVVNEGIANIDENAMEAVVEATADEEPVILPLTQVSEETVEKAVVDTNALETVAEAKKEVVIEFSDMTVKFDAKALKAITDQADGGTIEIRAVKAEEQHLSKDQKKGLDKKDVAAVVSVQIFSDGEYIGNFKGGKVTVKIPFQPEEGREGKHHKVYYVDDQGKTKNVPSEFIDGHMVFTTSHFSDYVIVYEAAEAAEDVQSEEVVMEEVPVEDENEAENDSVSFPVLPVIAVAAVIAIAAVVLVLKKKRIEE